MKVNLIKKTQIHQEKIYNLTDAQKIIEDTLNIKITYATLIKWVKNGLLIGSVVTRSGKRTYSLYTEHDIQNFTDNYQNYIQYKLIRKNYTRNAKG